VVWFKDYGDGRLDDETGETWFELNTDGFDLDGLMNASDEFKTALVAYLFGEDIVAKAKKYDNISSQNSANGKASAAKLTPEQRSERARKAVQARLDKKAKNKL
jgi:hypothetical protein